MADGLSYGLRAMQQGAEDYANAQKEAQKQEAIAIGNRGLYDQAVKAGVLDLDAQIQFNKGNAAKKNEILAGAMRTWDAQRQAEQDKMRQQAFQLQQNQDKREAARFNYQMPPQAAQALDQSGHVAIPTGPGQYQILAKPQPTPTQEQLDAIQAKAAEYGGGFIPKPGGGYEWRSKPTPQAPPIPTVQVPVPGGTPMPIPITNPAAQEQLKRMDPAAQAFSKFGAHPDDFRPENIVQGEIPFNDPKKYSFVPAGPPSSDPKVSPNAMSHVMLKNLGTTMTNAEYSAWLRKFAEAGQIDPVKNPVTGEMISPPQKAPVNMRTLDPSNASSKAIMQGFIAQFNGDVDAARKAAQAQGYTW